MPTILGGLSPCQQPTKDDKKGAFIYGNDAKAKNNVKSSLRFP